MAGELAGLVRVWRLLCHWLLQRLGLPQLFADSIRFFLLRDLKVNMCLVESIICDD